MIGKIWLTCKTPSHNSFVALLTYLGFQVMLRFCSSALGLCSNAFVRQSKKVDVIVYFCYIILISESSGNILSRIDNKTRLLLKSIEKRLIIVSQFKPEMHVTTISMSIILSIVNQDDNEHIMV